jgi:hypothetical protein
MLQKKILEKTARVGLRSVYPGGNCAPLTRIAMVATRDVLEPKRRRIMATKKTTQVNSAKKSKPAKAEKHRPPGAPFSKTSPKKLSALDAAARVLQETKQAMNCKDLIESMATKGYWNSPAGKTPHGTLYTAVTMLPKAC